MIDSLPLFHRIAGQPVIVVGSGDAAEARRRIVERAGGIVIVDVQDGIAKGARLGFIAHEAEDLARADAAQLKSAGLLINAADMPELCDFTMPSILDRAPVLIAIGTGGASAGLAKQLRLRLERILPQSLGRLASALYEVRPQLRARWPDASERRRALDTALGDGGALDPLREASVDNLHGWIAGAGSENAGELVEIHLRSNDPEDLTLREARLLGSADCIAHEPSVPSAVLERSRADAARIMVEESQHVTSRSGLTVVIRNA